MKKFVIFLMVILLLLPVGVQAKKHKKHKKIDMGEFKLTAYCPCCRCSKGYGRNTVSGKSARSNHTIAVDTDVIDLGSKVKIGGKIYTAEDCGSGVNGDHIDIFFDTHEEVEEFGVKHKHVWVVR